MSLPEPEDAPRIAALLDEDFAVVNADLSRAEREAVVRWQKVGRGYEAVQSFYRVGAASGDVVQWAASLDRVVAGGALARDIEAWRGIRSSYAAFGVPASEIGILRGKHRKFSGLSSATLSKSVALADFTRPELEGGPTLLRLSLPRRLRAAWIAGIGHADFRAQMELLLPDRLEYVIRTATVVEGIVVVDVEVVL